MKVEIEGKIFEFDGTPTDAEIEAAYDQAFPQTAKAKSTEGGSLRFDSLKDNKQYVSDLKAQYKADTGKDFDGNIEDLIEESFEDWNMTEFNLAKGAYDVGKFAMMDEDEAARNLRLYDVYSNTAATGEGSRSGWEQFKGVASAIGTDPTTYLSFGLGKAATTTGTREATKFGIRKALEGAIRPAGVGAGYSAVANTEMQLQQKALGGRDEFDVGELATATTVGAVATPLVKGGLSTVAKVPGAVKSGFNKLTSKPISERGQGLKEVAIRTMGGEQVAKQGVIEKGKEVLTGGTGGREEAASTVSNTINDAFDKSLDLFGKKFEALGGFANINKNFLQKYINELKDKGVPKTALGNLQYIVDNVGTGAGQIHPTKAARMFRSNLGAMFKNSGIPNNPNEGFNLVFKDAWLKMKRDFLKGAKDAGKLKEAVRLDKEYEEFVGLRGDKGLTKILSSPSAAQDVINQVLSSPDKAGLRIQEFLSKISRLAKASDNPTLLDETRQMLGQALAGTLFKGKGNKFLEFVSDPGSRKVLVELYGKENSVMFDKFAKIIQNAEANQGASTFWPRLLATTLPIGVGASIGGPFLGTVGAAAGFVGFNALLKSKAFQKAAMNLFAKDGTVNKGAAKQMEAALKKSGMQPSKIQEFMDRATGALSEVGTFRMTGEQ